MKEHLQQELDAIQEAGIFKRERVIISPQGANVKVNSGDDVVIMCANNYLGLSSHPAVIQAAKDTLDTHGFGMSSATSLIRVPKPPQSKTVFICMQLGLRLSQLDQKA